MQTTDNSQTYEVCAIGMIPIEQNPANLFLVADPGLVLAALSFGT
jgi:hypothetical protein